MMNMWGKMRGNSKTGQSAIGAMKEVTIDKKDKKPEVSLIKTTKTEFLVSHYESSNDKTALESENEDHSLQLFNLFEDIPQTPESEPKNADTSIVLDDIKLQSGINLGELEMLDSQLPELQLLKSSVTDKQTSSAKTFFIPPKATCSKPCRVKRLPAKLILSSVKMNKTKTVITKPKCVQFATFKRTTDDNFNGSLNGIVNCEEVANGSDSNIPNGEVKDKNIKITMTKIGNGMWAQSVTSIRKRRYNSWKRGKYEKCKKKVKLEPTDHDYSLISSPFNGKISKVGPCLNARRDPVTASSPLPRRRIKSSRLLNCVEPKGPSKLSLIAALDQQLPCQSACANTLENASAPKMSKVKCRTDVKAPEINASAPKMSKVKCSTDIKAPDVNAWAPKISKVKCSTDIKAPNINAWAPKISKVKCSTDIKAPDINASAPKMSKVKCGTDIKALAICVNSEAGDSMKIISKTKTKVKCSTDIKAPATCINTEARDGVRIISKPKKLAPKKPAKNRPLPKIVARKGKRPVGRPRLHKRDEVPELRKKAKKKLELAMAASLVDSSKTTYSDSQKCNESAIEKKFCSNKEVLKEKKAKSVSKEKKEKKALKEKKLISDKKKAPKIKKVPLLLEKNDIKPAKLKDKTCKKLTSKAKAIRMQLKAEKKKKLKDKLKDKEVFKEVKPKKVLNVKFPSKLVTNVESGKEEVSTPFSLVPTVKTIQSPKKMSLISELKKAKKAKMIETKESKESTPMASELKCLKNVSHISQSNTQTTPPTSNLNTDFKRGRGRPRTRLPTTPSIRFSRNGLRLGRPPKQKSSAAVTESNLLTSQMKFLQSTISTCYDTEPHSARETSTSVPDYLLPKTSIQSNAQLAKSKLVSKAPISLSAYTLPPQPLLVANNPKRSSVRQTECAFRYREIAVKKQDNFIQIVLMSSTRVKNGLNCQVMHELQMALMAAKSDSKCSVVVVNGTGSVFCSGVDLISLSMDLGQSTAEKTSSAIRDFCKALLSFPKPLIAAVNGAAVGLGVTFLPFFDLVYASDKATFYTPYGKLGQIPEGGATFTLPVLMGYAKANGLLLEGKRITATEAHDTGLVTQVLWPATFMEEVIPRVQAIANRPLQAMESTKALIRYHEQSKLEVTLDTECRILLQQWSSDECRLAIRDFLTTEEVV